MATIPANGEATANEHECVANENTGDAVKDAVSEAKTVFGNDAAEVISDAKTVSGNGAAEVIAKPKESRTEMLARHQREIKEFQNKELELKKDAAKGSKAQQKARKKEVEEETAKLRAKLKAKHDKELASLGYKSQDGKDSNDLDNLVKAIAGMNATDNVGHSGKPSKGLQRRAKRAQKEAERDQRIQEEQSNVISDRVLEDEGLQNKLKPLRLSLYEIKPDGHCLYRAVENQLSFQPGNSCKHSFQQLREMAATYMRNHANDFLPFFSCDSGHDTESNVDMQEKFEKYCHEVESTAAWGGHLELKALAHSLKQHVIVFSGNYPNVEIGEEYKSHYPSIMLSYHKHAYGLGEHYNSVVPVECAAALGR